MSSIQMKKPVGIAFAGIAILVLLALWLRWGPDSWKVQITGVTGDGRDVQYRIETVRAGSSDSLIFRNEDAGLAPPYLKFASADLQAEAGRITRECPHVPVTVHGYSMRIPWLDMFPNATSIDAPEHCIQAPKKGEGNAAVTSTR